MPPDDPRLAPSTWRNGKKAMKNKSPCHLLSASALLFIAGRQRGDLKTFLSAASR
jgi:hypothetical protein